MNITSDTGTYKIPGMAARKKIVFANTGSTTLYWGWEADTSADGPKQGIPFVAGAAVILDGAENLVGEPIYLAWTAGAAASINWTNK